MLCLGSCLIFPLPETLLYDIPDSLNDLKSMKRSIGNENHNKVSSHNSQYQIIDSNTLTLPRTSHSNTTMSDLHDLSSLNPKAILKSQQQQGDGEEKSLSLHSQTEIIQLNSNTSSLNGLSNPCYFTSLNETIDQYDVEQQGDNRVVISIRDVQNNHNNNNNSEDERENTRF